MPTIFGRIGDELYEAFFEPDPEKRRVLFAEWVDRASGTIASHIKEELASCVEFITESRWSEEGWKRGEAKLRRIQPEYHLVMDIKLRTVSTVERPSPILVDLAEDLLPGTDRNNRNKLLKESSVREASGMQAGSIPVSNEGDDDVGGRFDRSPNDDRSDSMNPNNDAYQAAIDNHANQMNVNVNMKWPQGDGQKWPHTGVMVWRPAFL